MSSRLARAVQIHPAANDQVIRTPGGDWRIERPNEIGPGLPVYPEASLVLPDHSARSAEPKGRPAELQSVAYHTSDPSDVVESWYVGHLGPEFVRNAGESLSDVPTGVLPPKNDTTFIGKRGNQIRIAAITADATGTQITLVGFTNTR